MRAELPQSPFRFDDSAAEPVRRRGVVAVMLVVASLALCAGVWLAYLTRGDGVAAITVCPPWAWAAAGLGAAGLAALCRAGRKLVGAAALVWLVYLIATADAPAALFRTAPVPADNARRLEAPGHWNVRIVTLNCGMGNVQAARELKRFRPQVVLLQESPSAAEVESLAHELFGDEGDFVRSGDATIIVHGEVTKAEPAPTARCVAASVRLKNGAELAVVSLRLEPALMRLDFWSPSCWRIQTENRRVRRRQLAEIMEFTAGVPPTMPLVVGGDFNAPPGDAVYRLLAPRLRDAFAEAGVGWGNTITNEFPFSRIDQVWIDRHWRPRAVQAQRSAHSDHRIVIADLTLVEP